MASLFRIPLRLNLLAKATRVGIAPATCYLTFDTNG